MSTAGNRTRSLRPWLGRDWRSKGTAGPAAGSAEWGGRGGTSPEGGPRTVPALDHFSCPRRERGEVRVVAVSPRGLNRQRVIEALLACIDRARGLEHFLLFSREDLL